MESERQKLKVGIIIQARMGSLRLPGKVLMDINSKPMIWHVYNRMQQVQGADEVILAIPDTEQDNALEAFAKEHTINFYRGEEHDVLSRFYEAAKKFGFDAIVRITADCPLIDPSVTDEIIKKHFSKKVDYTANNTIDHTFPKGLDVEVCNFNAFKKAFFEAKDEYEREHVMPYLYRHPELFSLQSIKAEGALVRPDLNVSVDTEKDIELVRNIYKHFKSDIFSLEQVIDFLNKN